MAYPDAYPILALGLTLNRFTEFDNDRNRYNPIDMTMGFNFGTVSWTEHWKAYSGWSTNVTIGAGPTRDQPTRFLQNELMHKPFNSEPYPSRRRARPLISWWMPR